MPTSGRSRSSRPGSFDEAVELLRTAVHHAPEAGRLPRRPRPRPRPQPALGARGDPGARAGDPARAAARRLPSPSSRRCSHGQGLRLRAQKAAEAALRLAPRDPRVRRGSPPSSGSGSRDRHEDHATRPHRRRPQAQGQRGHALRQPRAEALRGRRRHGRPRRGRGRLQGGRGLDQRVRLPHRRRRGDHLALRPRRDHLLRRQPPEDRDPLRQPQGARGHPGERRVRGHGHHGGRRARRRRHRQPRPRGRQPHLPLARRRARPSSRATTPGSTSRSRAGSSRPSRRAATRCATW